MKRLFPLIALAVLLASCSSAPSPLSDEPPSASTAAFPPISTVLVPSARYVAYLKGLPADRWDSVGQAMEHLLAMTPPLPDDAVSAFIDLVGAICEQADLPGSADPFSYKAQYCAYLYTSNGDLQAMKDVSAIARALEGRVSPEYSAYFALCAELKTYNLTRPYAPDGSLRVSPDALAESVALRTAFCEAYPSFILTQDLRTCANTDTAFLTKLESTPAPSPTPAQTTRYRNDALGFELTFPASWAGRYVIHDEKNGISINFLGESYWGRHGFGDDDYDVGTEFFEIRADFPDDPIGRDFVDSLALLGAVDGVDFFYMTSTDAFLTIMLDENDPLGEKDYQTAIQMQEEIQDVQLSFRAIR